jgi:hypothetical protein
MPDEIRWFGEAGFKAYVASIFMLIKNVTTTAVKKSGGYAVPDVGLHSFSGFVATTRNSRGLRLEKAFLKAAPEPAAAGSAIRADLIGPGALLVRIDTSPSEAEDPVIGAWLSLMDRDTGICSPIPSALPPCRRRS